MIHELRTYTVKAGTIGEVVKNSSTLSREIRGDNYGKLEGYWTTELGQLNQVMHMWSYSDLNERARLKAELAKNPRWVNEYAPLSAGNLVRQDIRLMNPIRPLAPPATPGNVYEFRYYRTKPGSARKWLDIYKEILPTREKYSKIVGLWHTDAGQPNEVCHLWSYPDLNTRATVRGTVMKDPAWQEFLKASAPLLDEQHAIVLLPAVHSPLK